MIASLIRLWRRLQCLAFHRVVEELWSEVVPAYEGAHGYTPVQRVRELECQHCGARCLDVDHSADMSWEIGLDRTYERRRWERAVEVWRRHQ